MMLNSLSTTTFLLLFVISLCSVAQDFEKLAGDKVDKGRIDIAEKFSHNFFTALKKGSHYEFKEEASDELKEAFTPEYQQTIYAKLKDEHGDYESVKYAETWVLKSSPLIKVIRLKGTFTKQSGPLEIRVVLDKVDKIAGFFIKPWNDKLN